MPTPLPQPKPAVGPSTYLLAVVGYDFGKFTHLSSLASAAATADEAGEITRGARARIVLQRTFKGLTLLWDWHAAVLKNGAEERKDGPLIFFSEQGLELVKYYLHQVWPAKVELSAAEPQTGATADQHLLVETATFVCETLSTGPGNAGAIRPTPGGAMGEAQPTDPSQFGLE